MFRTNISLRSDARCAPAPNPGRLAGLVAFAMLNVWAPSVRAQTFDQGASQRVVIGETVRLTLSGLRPDSEVVIKADRTLAYPAGVHQIATASFTADKSGRVDVTGSRPRSGGWDQADASGLFWSATPAMPFSAPANPDTFKVTAFVDAVPVAETNVTFLQDDGGLETRVAEGFPGAFLVQPVVGGPFPVIIVLGGSEGDDFAAKAVSRRLASLGYAVFGLPYYSPRSSWSPKGQFPDLPGAFVELPIERIVEARRWLKAQPGIDASRIGVLGASRGAEFALLAASVYPWIKAVAAIVPTDVVEEGWDGSSGARRSPFALNGKPFAFTPAPDLGSTLQALQNGLPASLRDTYDRGRSSHPERAVAARIPVERFRGALYVAGAKDDQIWSSATACQSIAETRARHHLGTELHNYDKAGHFLLGTGWEPTTVDVGGTRAGNATAQKDNWRSMTAFFARELSPATP